MKTKTVLPLLLVVSLISIFALYQNPRRIITTRDVTQLKPKIHSRNSVAATKIINDFELSDVKRDNDTSKRLLGINFTNVTHVKYVNQSFRDYQRPMKIGTSPRIPHIIHQTWDNDSVPVLFEKNVKSWRKFHPQWEYFFWTPETVESMLETFYPEYLDLYRDYATDYLAKANIMRYFIMHKFGGVYADLDVESLRPLDNWTWDNDCVVSENNHLHSFVVRKGAERAEIMITILASRPGHPYFKLAIEMLPLYKNMPFDEKLLFADKIYVEYLKSKDSRTEGNRVTVVHPDVFLPTYDRRLSGTIKRDCFPEDSSSLSTLALRACEGLVDETGGIRPKRWSYTNHYWEHVNMWGPLKASKRRNSIQSIAPWAHNIKHMLKERPLL